MMKILSLLTFLWLTPINAMKPGAAAAAGEPAAEEPPFELMFDLPLDVQRKVLKNHPIKDFILKKTSGIFHRLQCYTATGTGIGIIHSLAFSPDDTKLATGTLDRTAIIWDVATGNQQHQLRGHTDLIESVAFSPDGTKLATGSLDRTAIIWDVATGNQQHRLQGHTDLIRSVAFSPDGTKLATGSFDTTAIIWDVATGNQQHQLRGHERHIESVAFSHDGTKLATGSFDNTAIIWDLTGQQVKNFFSPLAAPTMNQEQIKLLLGLWEAIRSRWRVQATEEQWAVFQSLPRVVQDALRLYICREVVTPEGITCSIL